MKNAVSSSVLAAVVAAGLSIVFSNAPAQAATMKECAAQWNTMKAAKQTEGKTYREFSKTCMGGSASAKSGTATSSDLAKDAGAGDVKAKKSAKVEKADTAEKKSAKPSEGRAAAVARQKECGAEWKADKAAGKVEKGMKWPQYWSACSKRKKGESA